jgi:hypothetical protein
MVLLAERTLKIERVNERGDIELGVAASVLQESSPPSEQLR